nr:MAG TPA: hypothetical protein [Bacteriophage sp.]
MIYSLQHILCHSYPPLLNVYKIFLIKSAVLLSILRL